MKIETALQKLNTLLPLHKRQSTLSVKEREVHQAILTDFVTRGKVPPVYDNEILCLLDEYDLIVLDKAGGEVTGAYPFSLRTTPHSVKIGKVEICAMCAFDAIAIAPVFNTSTSIKSHCHVTKNTLEISQCGSTVNYIQGSDDLCIGIRWQDTGSCAAESLCMEMIFLKDKNTALQWQDSSSDKTLFSLTEALEFATRYFKPLTEAK